MASASRLQAKSKPATRRSKRTVLIRVRVDAETRELIDQAAALTGQTRSEFVVDALRDRTDYQAPDVSTL